MNKSNTSVKPLIYSTLVIHAMIQLSYLGLSTSEGKYFPD